MQIITRPFRDYWYVTIYDDSTTLALGLHDKDECKALAETLVNAANDIVDGGSYEFVEED